MHWIKKYKLFLFDLDGLLVNTEPLHYQAYLNVCTNREVRLNLNFFKYCQIAHAKSQGLKDFLETEYPQLFKNKTSWLDIYNEKKSEYLKLLKTEKIELMEGVLELLTKLSQSKIKSCVVTNSTKEQVDLITANQPFLELINYWVTRECYKDPKPSSECYLRAIKLYGSNLDGIIGFEDSLKGIKALLGSPAKVVLISNLSVNNAKNLNDVSHFRSFKEIPKNF